MRVHCSQLGAVGRLGNQLWEIASTLGIARSQGLEPSFPDWDYQNVFSCPAEYFGQRQRKTDCKTEEFATHLDPRVQTYLQDFSLWSASQDEVKDWLTPSAFALSFLDDQYEWFDSLERPLLSLHVRMGDNARDPNKYHPLRPNKYYFDALRKMEGKFATLVVFSDDLEWCRNTFTSIDATTVFFQGGSPRKKEHEPGYRTDPFNDWIDLLMQAKCDRHVISNSSYAWWGAYLSGDENPIYPSPFFGPLLRYIDASRLFPSTWVRLEHGL